MPYCEVDRVVDYDFVPTSVLLCFTCTCCQPQQGDSRCPDIMGRWGTGVTEKALSSDFIVMYYMLWLSLVHYNTFYTNTYYKAISTAAACITQCLLAETIHCLYQKNNKSILHGLMRRTVDSTWCHWKWNTLYTQFDEICVTDSNICAEYFVKITLPFKWWSKMTSFGAAGDEYFVNLTIFSFHTYNK